MAIYLGQNEVILRNGISTTDADATAADILVGKTAYVDDKKIIGTMPVGASAGSAIIGDSAISPNMNFYTENYASVPTTAAADYAASDISNTVADMLVTYGGFSFVKHATSGSASSSSNYAEISKDGFNIRLYYNTYNGSDVNLCFDYYYTDGSTYITQSYTGYFEYNSKYPNAFEIKLRVFNCKAGTTYFQIGSDVYMARVMPVTTRCTRISTGEEKMILLTELYSNSTCYLNGDTSSLKIPALNGLYDADGVKQVLSPVGIIAGSSAGCRYILKDFYQSSAYKNIGSVQIGDRYFYIYAINFICFELNAPS